MTSRGCWPLYYAFSVISCLQIPSDSPFKCCPTGGGHFVVRSVALCIDIPVNARQAMGSGRNWMSRSPVAHPTEDVLPRYSYSQQFCETTFLAPQNLLTSIYYRIWRLCVWALIWLAKFLHKPKSQTIMEGYQMEDLSPNNFKITVYIHIEFIESTAGCIIFHH